MAVLIPVRRAAGALVDAEDVGIVSARNWYAVRRGAGLVYAESGAQPQIMMHRLILGDACKGMVVDHIDGNGLNNLRGNLRVCTQRENSRNRRSVRGYRGVSWKADIGRWRARIMVDRREISLGAFDTPEQAAEAYNRAAAEYYGQFAKINIFGPADSRCEDGEGG